ncbi:MAG: NfeD family protein [Bacteroidales bacterium]
MSWTLIILLFLIGLVLLLIEMLIIPGATVFGLLGFGALAASIWQAYASHGTPEGHYFLIGAIIFTVVLLAFALKSKTWKKAMLDSEVKSKVNVVEPEKVKPGDEGKTISRLAPAGKAYINGEYYEVHSLGEYIEPQSDIVVVQVEFSKIIVKLKN